MTLGYKLLTKYQFLSDLCDLLYEKELEDNEYSPLFSIVVGSDSQGCFSQENPPSVLMSLEQNEALDGGELRFTKPEKLTGLHCKMFQLKTISKMCFLWSGTKSNQITAHFHDIDDPFPPDTSLYYVRATLKPRVVELH